MSCIFCEIVKKQIPSSIIYEDKQILAFKDVTPQAPIHVLIIPKEHIASTDEITSSNCSVVAHIFEKIPQIANTLEIKNGYRIVINCGKEGGQTVEHLHFHLLADREMTWPPG